MIVSPLDSLSLACPMVSHPIRSPDVAAVFDRSPPAMKQRLLELRELILNTAAAIPTVGLIEETLKWGQPSYLTSESNAGTTIRIGAASHGQSSGPSETQTPCKYGLYVHCQSKVVNAAKQRYPTELDYDGTRAVVFDVDQPIPVVAVVYFIELALTYHRWK